MKRRSMFPQTRQVVHECGLPLTAINDGTAPHFIADGLHMELCPRCYRNLINDWMDESWRFWTPEAWEKLSLWRNAIDHISEESV